MHHRLCFSANVYGYRPADYGGEIQYSIYLWECPFEKKLQIFGCRRWAQRFVGILSLKNNGHWLGAGHVEIYRNKYLPIARIGTVRKIPIILLDFLEGQRYSAPLFPQ